MDIVKKYSLVFQSVIGTLLIVQFLFGVIFNIAVFVACRLSRRNKKDCPVGNTLTLNLCFVDLLICATGMTLALQMVTGSRNQESLFCLFQRGTESFASSATAVNLLIISFDRFDAVTHPFRRRINPQNVVCVLVISWLVAFIGFIIPVIARISDVGNYDMLANIPCFLWIEMHRVYIGVFYLALYVVANGTMVVCYFRIYRVARKRINIRLALVQTSFPRLNQTGEERRKDHNQALKSSERALTRTSLMIVTTYIICWAPHTVVNVVMMFIESSLRMEMLQLSCLTLAFFSSVLHPILYVFSRKPFRQVLCSRIRKNKISVAGNDIAQEVATV